MYRVYAGGCSFNKICTRKKKGATTQHTPSCLKTCLYRILFLTTIETIETTFVMIVFVNAKPVVSIVSIVVLIICLAMQISYKE